MGKLLAYLIISGITMLAMYLIYKLFIARDKQHGFNRALLLAIYLVSFSAYPLYNLFDKIASEPEIKNTNGIVEVGNITLEPTAQPIWGTILIWIFLIGALIVTIRTIITWMRIVRVVRSGERLKKDGYTLVVINNDKIAPFSWMHYVVINREDFDNQNSAIIAHELKHIRSFHWLDLLIAQIVCIVNWFNPAAWFMRDELMLVHEYQADMSVIDNGHNPQEYQMLLIKKAVGSRFPSLANSINHSKLKKRITMMYKAKSCAGSKLKALALVPMVALALGVATVPAVKAAVSTISNSDVSLDKGNENLQSNQVSLPSGMTILLDGKEISEAEMKSLNPNNIESVIVSKEQNVIVIHTTDREHINISENDIMKDGSSQMRIKKDGNKEIIVTGVGTMPRVEAMNKIIITSNSSDNMEIYLDGKKISENEMKALNPETIASMSIDKQNNKITITSK